jgi:hypothetical protein
VRSAPLSFAKRRAAERIELQVQLETRKVVFEPPREVRLLRDPHPVRVHHQVLDRPLLGGVEDLPELRVDRRLAAGDLDDVGLAFVADYAVHHELDLLERRCVPTRCGDDSL